MRRRDFIKSAALAGAALGLAPPLRMARAARNDRLQIGVIGCNGMGWTNTASLLKMDDVDVVAICDVDRTVIDRRLNDYRHCETTGPTSTGTIVSCSNAQTSTRSSSVHRTTGTAGRWWMRSKRAGTSTSKSRSPIRSRNAG